MSLSHLFNLSGVPTCGHKTRYGRCLLDRGHSGGHIYPDAVAARRRKRK